jgi:hypothetical protein
MHHDTRIRTEPSASPGPAHRALAGRPLDAELDTWLNAEHGAGSTTYQG